MKTSRTPTRKIALVLAAVACAALTGCTDFKKVWEEEMAKPPQKHTDLTGAWEGTWTSSFNGHTGKLRCIVTKQQNGEYEFHYWAQWQKVLSGSFRQNYKVDEKTKGTFTFEGEKDLGKLGGKFTHKGKATAKTFEATYDSDSGDNGVFKLTRPQKKEKQPDATPTKKAE